jgi:hypothetical protein
MDSMVLGRLPLHKSNHEIFESASPAARLEETNDRTQERHERLKVEECSEYLDVAAYRDRDCFGLAKRLESDSRQTETGQIMRTPFYMAPEQAMGHTRDVGRISRLWRTRSTFP